LTAGTGEDRVRRTIAAGLRILVVAAGYYATAEMALRLGLARGQVMPLWLSTGIALACLLMLGFWTWPAIALAAFAVNLSTAPSIATATAVAVGDTLGPVCAYLLLRSVRFRLELDRLRDALALVFLGAFAGMLISATVGSAALLSAGTISAGDLWKTWSVWWTGDTTGVLVVVPFLLVVRFTRLPRLRPSRWVEGAALIAGTALVTIFVTRTKLDLLFLVFPLLIWAALRFEHVGAAPCVLVASLIATLAAAHGSGPFADNTVFERMVILQAFNGSAALTAFLLAAITAERNLARRDVERVAADLTKMAIELESGHMTLKSLIFDLVRAQERRTRHRQPSA
jgi:integral membrane sensor domain MASE1